MDKFMRVNQKRKHKQPKNKQKQPLKIVYVTNPVKINATTSEFRSLVQELTGKYSDISELDRYAVADCVAGGQGEAVVVNAGKMAVEENAYPPEQEVSKLGQTSDIGEVVEKGWDPLTFGSYIYDDDDACYTTKMLENFPGLMTSYQWYN